MEKHKIRVLLIEDDEDDYFLTRSYFQQFGNNRFTLEWASTYKAGLEAVLLSQYDVYLVDYRLGEHTGLELLQEARSRGCSAPIILLTGQGGYDVDVQAMNAGAADYLVKSQLHPALLERSIRYAFEHSQYELRIRRQASRAEALVRVSARLNEKLDLKRILHTLCEESIRGLSLPAASVSLYEPRQRLFVPADAVGLSAAFQQQLLPVRMNSISSPLGRKTPITVFANLSQASDEDNFDLFARFGVGGFGRAFIARNGHPLGILYVYSLKKNLSLTDEDLTFLRGLVGQAAQALSNAQLLVQERSRRRELSALVRLSTRLRASQTSQDILSTALDEAQKLLKAETGAVILRSSQGYTVQFALANGQLSQNTSRQFSSDQEIFRKVLSLNRAYTTPDYASDLNRVDGLDGLTEIGPAVFVPIRSEVETMGILMLARQRGAGSPVYPVSEVRLLSSIGEMVGNSLRRIWLYEDVQRRASYNQTVHEIDRAIASSLDLHLTLNIALQKGLIHLGADAGAVLLYNPSAQALDFIAGTGFLTDTIKVSRRIMGPAWPSSQTNSQRAFIPKSLPTGKDVSRTPLAKREKFVSSFSVPLIAKEQLKGVLEVYGRKQFEVDDRWLEFLETLASQMAVAVDNAVLFETLQQTNANLANAYESTLEGWSRALDLRDRETEGHTQRVTDMTLRLAASLGISGEDLIQVRRGALLHDIGKMAIPDHILLKPGPLTGREWSIMRRHTGYAFELLSPIDYLRPSLDIPYCHHERWDGKGYPRRLRGDEIPLPARIFAVVDVWDALLSDRPYRSAWSVTEVLDYIQDETGSHFDPQVSEAFLGLVDSEKPGISEYP